VKKILFIQHGETDRPGLLEESLCAGGIALQIAHPYVGEPLPATLEAFSGLAVGGGGQGAYEVEKYPARIDC
jgi:GMP synthase (glutamine-hydrolysing)